MRQSNGWFLVGNIVANRSDDDWLIDLWAWFGFAKKYPAQSLYQAGSRSMNLQLREDKRKLRHQKNLNCLPIEIADSEERWAIPTDMYYDFKVLRDNAGWVMPYENICFISERPTEQNFDQRQLLHCETGPAIIYPDGFSIYAWRGTVFPKAWLETKPSASEALQWTNTEQRRVACEIVGWDTILNELDADIIDKDNDPEVGEVISVNIPGIGQENFLRVRCGTGRKFALPVPPNMETARQANAWT